MKVTHRNLKKGQSIFLYPLTLLLKFADLPLITQTSQQRKLILKNPFLNMETSPLIKPQSKEGVLAQN